MKKTITAVVLLLFALSFSFIAAQKTDPVKRVQVTSRAIAGKRKGQSYVLDFTRKGTIYSLAPGSDYSRVRVKTAKGDRQVTDLLRGRTIKGNLIVGLTADLRGQKLGLGGRPGGGTLQMDCSDPLICTCTGDKDCNDLFSSGKCGDLSQCDTGTGICWCIKSL